MNLASSPAPRHHALDWMRVLGILCIFLYHSGAPFMPSLWHLKAPEISLPITITGTWLLLWGMPLFFFLSGAGTSFALRRQTRRTFSRRRVQRLLPPLLFGILVVVPPQVYIERITRGQFSGSFLDFLPHYFDGWYLTIGGDGNFAWMGLHLWYLLYLLVLTFLTLPLLLWINRSWTRFEEHRLIQYLRRPGTVLLLGVPLALIELAWGNVGVGGWNMLAYPLFFLYGYVLYALPDVTLLIRKVTLPALAGGIVIAGALLVSLFAEGPVPYGLYEHGLERVGHALGGWFWLLALVGLAYRFLDIPHRLLHRLNEAVLPFYVLHQTFIVVFGYYVVRLDLSPGPQFLVLMLTSFVGIIATYEVLVRRSRLLRFSFGMAMPHASAMRRMAADGSTPSRTPSGAINRPVPTPTSRPGPVCDSNARTASNSEA